MIEIMKGNIAKELLKYMAENLETESIFLSPNPVTSVEVTGLLDKIAELRGVSKEENGKEFNMIMDKLESGK
jgi:hypothetical protein